MTDLVVVALAGLLLAQEGAPARAEAEAPAEDRPLAPAVEAMIVAREKQVKSARAEAIKLLEDFLADSGRTPETAEALFKLAELTWEDAQDVYLVRMGRYQEQVTACKRERRRCSDLPARPPRLDLSRSEATYRRLVTDYPRFRKLDTVLYLYAFSLRDQGKSGEAVAMFERLLAEHPRSRFRPDAYMAVAEYRFYEQQDFAGAKRYYEKVLEHKGSPLTGLALFQTAFCAWKLGRTEEAALRWKEVLDLGVRSKSRGSKEEEKRAAELSDQATEYLVELFTEDDSKTAADAHEFLAQIGGKAYSQRVLRRFAEAVYEQARYERAAEAYRFLIDQDPRSADAPAHQQRVVDSWLALGRAERAAAEMRRLALDYGPKSEWASAHSDRPKLVAEARSAAEGYIRNQAKGMHAQAQRNEKDTKHVDQRLYGQAAASYAFFLEQFPDAKDAQEIRYLRADILAFKLGDSRAAGHEYLAVGRSTPVGSMHKESLLAAMNAFEKLRKPAAAPAAGGKRPVSDDDRRFAEAADLYATLFPKDKEIVTVIYKNGQFFYDHGDYDEAVKRFGLIIEQHPGSPTAAAAGDRLLESLGAAKDWANIESWSRRLKKTKAFSARREQSRLDGLIAGAMLKQAEERVARKEYGEAAELFRKVGREFPGHTDAPAAWNNAGAAAEKAGRPQEAVAAYKALAEQHPKHAQAAGALLTAAKIEESIAGYARAAALYELLAKRYPQSPEAPAALRQAGLMRQTLGQHERAAGHYGEFERLYRDRPEAAAVLFQKGLALGERKDWKGSAATFGQYSQKHERDPAVVEALVRKAEAHLALGDDGQAKESLSRSLSLHKSLRRPADTSEHAAHARYLQGELLHRQYERVKIAGRPRQLRRALEEKAKLLDEARRIYLDVPSFKVPEWATAALLRVGQAYDAFAKAMRKAEVPRELSAEERRLYREELERQVVVIEDKALDAYRAGHAKALEIGIYNRHTRALRQALSTLAAREFPPEVEARPGLRPGELRVALEPIEDLHRD